MRMIDLTIAQIAEIVGGSLADISPADAAQRRVTGTVEFDSRAIGPGGLFLALPGARSDGHAHAQSAVGAGAVAVLAARPVGVPVKSFGGHYSSMRPPAMRHTAQLLRSAAQLCQPLPGGAGARAGRYWPRAAGVGCGGCPANAVGADAARSTRHNVATGVAG